MQQVQLLSAGEATVLIFKTSQVADTSGQHADQDCVALRTSCLVPITVHSSSDTKNIEVTSRARSVVSNNKSSHLVYRVACVKQQNANLWYFDPGT